MPDLALTLLGSLIIRRSGVSFNGVPFSKEPQ